MTNDTATPKTIAERFPGATQRPWAVHAYQESGEFGSYSPLCIDGVQAGDTWVVRFDDDYGTNQSADAELITYAVNRIEALEASHARLLEKMKEIAAVQQTLGVPHNMGVYDAWQACLYKARAAIEAAKEVTT